MLKRKELDGGNFCLCGGDGPPAQPNRVWYQIAKEKLSPATVELKATLMNRYGILSIAIFLGAVYCGRNDHCLQNCCFHAKSKVKYQKNERVSGCLAFKLAT
jgi:hypothetical protein